MSNPENDPLLWKVIGAFLGAVISLAYLRPKNLKDALYRAFVSITCGIVFGFVLHDYFELKGTFEHWIAASAGVSILSWFVIGMIVRVLSSMDKLPKI